MTQTVKRTLALMATPIALAFSNVAVAQQGAHPYSASSAEAAAEFLADEGYSLHGSMSSPSGHVFTLWCHETRNSGILMVFVAETDRALVYQSVPVCDPHDEPA